MDIDREWVAICTDGDKTNIFAFHLPEEIEVSHTNAWRYFYDYGVHSFKVEMVIPYEIYKDIQTKEYFKEFTRFEACYRTIVQHVGSNGTITPGNDDWITVEWYKNAHPNAVHNAKGAISAELEYWRELGTHITVEYVSIVRELVGG